MQRLNKYQTLERGENRDNSAKDWRCEIRVIPGKMMLQRVPAKSGPMGNTPESHERVRSEGGRKGRPRHGPMAICPYHEEIPQSSSASHGPASLRIERRS